MSPQWQHTAHNVSVVISVKPSAWWRFSPNIMAFLMTVSLSSAFITVIFTLAVYFSLSARMASMKVGDSSNLGVQVSLTLLAPTLTSCCISSIPPAFLLYRSRFILCTRTWCYFGSLVASRTLRLTLLGADRITSLLVSSSIPLGAVVSGRSLRLPFSLYDIRWSYIYVSTLLMRGVLLTDNTRCAASPRLPASAPTFRERRILLSVSGSSLTCSGNYAPGVLSCAVPRPTVVVYIFQFTVYHCSVRSVLALDAPTVVMLVHVRG